MKLHGLLVIVMATTLWAGAGVAEAALLWRGWHGSQRRAPRANDRRGGANSRARQTRAGTQRKPNVDPKEQQAKQGQQAGEDAHTTQQVNLSPRQENTSSNRGDHRMHVAFAAAGAVAALVLFPKFTVGVVAAGVLAAVAYALVPPMLAAMRHQGEGSRFDAFSGALTEHLNDTAQRVKERAGRARELSHGAGRAWSHTLSWLGEALSSLAGRAGSGASAAR